MIKKRSSVCLLMIILSLSCFTYIAGCGQNPTGGHHHAAIPIPSWHIETVDTLAYPPCLLALDGTDRPHILCLGYTNSNDLAYASFDGSSWQRSMVTSESLCFSLAVDQNNQPNIIYRAGNHLKRSTLEGSSWLIDTVQTSAYPEYISCAVNLNGRIHVVYLNENTHTLRYATKEAGSSWINSNIQASTGEYTSIDLDNSGQPHICYKDSGGIKYAALTGSGWDIQVVTIESGRDTSIVIDGGGVPHISYYDTSNWDLKYAKLVGATWEIVTVDSDGYVGKSSSLTLDSSGRPHICYVKAITDDVKHAWWTGTTWEAEIIEGGEWVSSVMANSGKLCITFISSGLKFAEYR